ncbi:hypothetical protein CLAFUW4_14415 [Fulvia fulva]|uniref:Uncharacterized protein n=1 Tax=Passalora fulva TaxID=5499 RepID=A0A9Q8PMK4_PASFU|nr:uncharacterized protein CLAFUR5_14247 [Fulvia fulva]KAK4609119.1 hypothetical protein CLAFUR4_14411 [Fulvia fulva]KAK4609825.1 hypothetical protein CLAFUR0_14415 [Fulvia fulva]UJO25296.1 hypothetical protein CLAFUR5_14247 [Fulvia fulva]WPV22666.1 hypothetical protein CLAFUW4_14415 [Fulvia fulva]WPV37677.1 hypothetical protein CLAFUW7_14420 [Fulvia fulva]
MATSPSRPMGVQKRPRKQRKLQGKKLDRLPEDATVAKRPLFRPAIPSPYAGAQSQKVVYVGTKTPFMSVVKRAEKLLHLADKRQVQSATKIVQNDRKQKRKRDGDEIGDIARQVEKQKKSKITRDEDDGPEEVVVKGTGKAIPKVMGVGSWFQQRDGEYTIRLKTSTTSSIDDVEYTKQPEGAEDSTAAGAEDGTAMDGESPKDGRAAEKAPQSDGAAAGEVVEETRIRKVSILEVYVSLR